MESLVWIGCSGRHEQLRGHVFEKYPESHTVPQRICYTRIPVVLRTDKRSLSDTCTSDRRSHQNVLRRVCTVLVSFQQVAFRKTTTTTRTTTTVQ